MQCGSLFLCSGLLSDRRLPSGTLLRRRRKVRRGPVALHDFVRRNEGTTFGMERSGSRARRSFSRTTGSRPRSGPSTRRKFVPKKGEKIPVTFEKLRSKDGNMLALEGRNRIHRIRRSEGPPDRWRRTALELPRHAVPGVTRHPADPRGPPLRPVSCGSLPSRAADSRRRSPCPPCGSGPDAFPGSCRPSASRPRRYTAGRGSAGRSPGGIPRQDRTTSAVRAW